MVIDHLQELGHDVYQEVEVAGMGGSADIVCLVNGGPEVWIIETKTSWSLELLQQCLIRRRMAHRIFAAVPYGPRNVMAGPDIAHRLGIGVMQVARGAPEHGIAPRIDLTFGLPPRLTSRRLDWIEVLRPEHKTAARAGGSGAGRWTPYRATCAALADFVRAHPGGVPLRQAIESVKHHYATPSTARSSLAHWIRSRRVPGVRCEMVEGRIVLFPSGVSG